MSKAGNTWKDFCVESILHAGNEANCAGKKTGASYDSAKRYSSSVPYLQRKESITTIDTQTYSRIMIDRR